MLEVARRLDVASESLDRAREAEDFQAVGMRLRETLLTLAAKLAGLGYQTAAVVALQQGNFKAWSSVCADAVARGSSAQHLRALLKTFSEKTWNYVAWLTHEQASSRAAAESVHENWANLFAFFFPEDASLADVHRIAYAAFIHAPTEGAELAYACDETA